MDCSLEDMDDPNDFATLAEIESLLKEWPMKVTTNQNAFLLF